MKAIEEMAPQGPTNIVQPVAIFRQATWDLQGKPNYNQFLMQQECNSIPVWGGFGNDSGVRLADQYEWFLNTVIQRTPLTIGAISTEDQAVIDENTAKVKKAAAEKKLLVSQMQTEWEEYVHDNASDPNRYNYSYWQSKESVYYPQIVTKTSEIDSANSVILVKFGKYSNIPAMELAKAKKVFEQTSQTIDLPEREYLENDPAHWNRYYQQGFKSDLSAFRTKPDQNVAYAIDIDKTESTTIQSSWGGSVGFSTGWWSVSGGASGSSLDEEAKSSVTAISIGFKRLEDFPVFRSPWFNMAIIQKYGDKALEFFGPHGTLNVIPLSFIIGRGVTLKVSCSDEHSRKVEDHFKASGGFGIGPFNFSANRSTDKVYAKMDRDATSYTMIDLSDMCYIIGVRCVVPFANTFNSLVGDALFQADMGMCSPVDLSSFVDTSEIENQMKQKNQDSSHSQENGHQTNKKLASV